MNSLLPPSYFLLLTLLFPSILISQQDSSFFFVQLADPQFGMYPFTRNFKKERQNVAKAIAEINKLHSDFVVVCGDLINKAGDAKQIKAYKESFSGLDSTIPVFLVAGNHDVGDRPTPASLDRFRKDFGPDHYSFERHGVRFIVINSSLMKAPSKAPEEDKKQKDWLKTQLDSSRETIVFQHHPWFVDNLNEVNSYWNIPKTTRKKYLKLFEEKGVRAVFAGHLHRNVMARYHSMIMVASGPVGMPLGLDPSGFRVVRVYRDRIVQKYYALTRD